MCNQFYLIVNGNVTPLRAQEVKVALLLVDGRESHVYYADSEEQALMLAKYYDMNIIEQGNIYFCDQEICVVQNSDYNLKIIEKFLQSDSGNIAKQSGVKNA